MTATDAQRLRVARASGRRRVQVDTDRDAGLLSKFGLDPQDLLGKLGGLGNLGGGLPKL